jgi:hypothetical protein
MEPKLTVFEDWTPCRLPEIYRKSGQFALKVSLSPSWICHDVVTVEAILPAVGDTLLPSSGKTIRPEGTAKFGWFGKKLQLKVRDRSRKFHLIES